MFLLTVVSFFLSSWGLNATARNTEIDRLSGFAKHQKENQQYDKARQQGERAYLEEEEQWENKKLRELEEYKKQSKKRLMSEEGPEAKEDAAQKKKLQLQREEDKEAYVQERKTKKSFDRQALGLPSEMKELGLDQERPRYDYRRRASFGATPRYGKNLPSSSGSSGGYSGGGSSGGSFPPPPTFDDFQDGGYLPAPTLNDDYMGDIPPPPPPPSFGDSNFSGEGSDFPPPPPPPPTFGDDPDF